MTHTTTHLRQLVFMQFSKKRQICWWRFWIAKRCRILKIFFGCRLLLVLWHLLVTFCLWCCVLMLFVQIFITDTLFFRIYIQGNLSRSLVTIKTIFFVFAIFLSFWKPIWLFQPKWIWWIIIWIAQNSFSKTCEKERKGQNLIFFYCSLWQSSMRVCTALPLYKTMTEFSSIKGGASWHTIFKIKKLKNNGVDGENMAYCATVHS